jgi:hypothetical protein
MQDNTTRHAISVFPRSEQSETKYELSSTIFIQSFSYSLDALFAQDFFSVSKTYLLSNEFTLLMLISAISVLVCLHFKTYFT